MTDRDEPADLLLSNERLVELFHTRVVPLEVAGRSVDHPGVIMLAGQTGAGKSSIATAITADLGLSEAAVTVNTDRVRVHHPALSWLLRHDELHANQRTDADARAWVRIALRHTMDHRYDVVFDGTLSRPDVAREIAGEFRAAGYRSAIVFMAVPAAYSWLGVLERCQRNLEHTGYGWYALNHDETYVGLVETAAVVDAEALVDEVRVYRRGGHLLYRNHRDEQGQWEHTPGTRAAIETERARPRDVQELRVFAGAALALGERMDARWRPDIARAVELAVPLAATQEGAQVLEEALAHLKAAHTVTASNPNAPQEMSAVLRASFPGAATEATCSQPSVSKGRAHPGQPATGKDQSAGVGE